MKPYVLLCHARCGSTLIAQGLEQHPDVRMFGEVFNKNPQTRGLFFTVEGRPWRDDEDGASFVRDVVYHPREDGAAVGFKLMYSDVWRGASASAWPYLVERKDVRVLHLHRDNLLEALVSLETAQRSRQWAIDATVETERKLVPPYRIEIERCESYFAKHVEWADGARAALGGHRYLELEYARDVAGRFPEAMAGIWRFLDVAERPVRETLVKQAVFEPRRQLSNYDELAAHFRDGRFARFFVD